jgi:propane monooxygenase reductase component
MFYKVKIVKIVDLAKNVKRFVVEKPKNYNFVAGQYTSISINKSGFESKKRLFTFASSSFEKNLEFIIKIYPEHEKITFEMNKLKKGDELIIGPPLGRMSFQGNGIFIAAGSGITPFLAIFKELKKKSELKGNFLIYSNKFKEDVICEKELRKFLGNNLIITLTQEKIKGYEFGRVDETLIQKYVKNFNQKFYLCGPKTFVLSVKEILEENNFNSEDIIFEK